MLKKKELKKNRNLSLDKIKEELFLKNLYKIGYLKKTPKKIKKEVYSKILIKTFQRRFRQALVNGKIDRECLLISMNLLKKFN